MMNNALNKIDHQLNTGVKKAEIEASLQYISDQIRWIEQKLTIKVEKEIYKSYQHQHHLINQTGLENKNENAR